MSDSHHHPFATSTASDNRRNISMPRMAIFLVFLPSLLFNIAVMHGSLSKSDDEAAYLAYPILEYSPSHTNGNHHNPSIAPPPISFQPQQRIPEVQLPTTAASYSSSTYLPPAEHPSPTGSVNTPIHPMVTLLIIQVGAYPLVEMESSDLIFKTFKMRLLTG